VLRPTSFSLWSLPSPPHGIDQLARDDMIDDSVKSSVLSCYCNHVNIKFNANTSHLPQHLQTLFLGLYFIYCTYCPAVIIGCVMTLARP